MKKEEMILKSTSISFVMGLTTRRSAPVNLKENSGIQVNKEPSLGLEIPDSRPLLILGEEPACLEELMSSRIWEVGMKSPLLFKAVEVQDRWGGGQGGDKQGKKTNKVEVKYDLATYVQICPTIVVKNVPTISSFSHHVK